MKHIRRFIYSKKYLMFLGVQLLIIVILPFVLSFLNTFKLGDVDGWVWVLILVLYSGLHELWYLLIDVFYLSAWFPACYLILDLIIYIGYIIKIYLKMRHWKR